MPDQITQLEKRIAALEQNRFPFNPDAQNKSNLSLTLKTLPGYCYPGNIQQNGTATSLPQGWTSARNSGGNYTVTHNLGHTNYVVVISSKSVTRYAVATGFGVTTFSVLSYADIGITAADADFLFSLVITK